MAGDAQQLERPLYLAVEGGFSVQLNRQCGRRIRGFSADAYHGEDAVEFRQVAGSDVGAQGGVAVLQTNIERALGLQGRCGCLNLQGADIDQVVDAAVRGIDLAGGGDAIRPLEWV